MQICLPLLKSPTECGKAEGTAVLMPATYEYAWSDGGTGASRNDLAAGTYIVTATDPSNPANQDMVEVEIASVGGLTVSHTINALAQCGKNNGSVTINATGGSGQYIYSWGADKTRTTRLR